MFINLFIVFTNNLIADDEGGNGQREEAERDCERGVRKIEENFREGGI